MTLLDALITTLSVAAILLGMQHAPEEDSPHATALEGSARGENTSHHEWEQAR